MTIASETSSAGPYAGDDSTDNFSFAFKVFAAADIAVVLTDSTGADTTLTITTHYTVSLNADQEASPGGSVTLLTPPATGENLTILRDMTLTQGAALPNQGGWYPEVIEDALDKLTMITQQLEEKIDRAIVVGVTDDPATYLADAEAAATAVAASQAAASVSASAASASASAASASEIAAAASAAAIGFTASSSTTFTNKTVNLSSNTLTGTTAEFNAALSDGNFATQAGTETLTNKTIAALTNTIEARFGPDSSAFSFRNKIINGGFDVWQRGTSAAGATAGSAAAAYVSADRWMFCANGFNAGSTFSRQTGPTAARYCVRMQRDNGNATITGLFAQHTLETANSIWAQGKSVTLSFKARCGALYNAGTGTGNLVATIRSGTGTDEAGGPIRTAFTGAASVATDTKVLTTTWQTFTLTGSVGASATQLSIDFQTAHSGTAGATDYVEIAEVQLESGQTATPFETRPYGVELALCQRYYYRRVGTTTDFTHTGQAIGPSVGRVCIPFPVTMRTSPTGIETSTAGGFYLRSSVDGATSASTITFGAASPSECGISVSLSSSILTAGDATVFTTTAGSYIGFTGAEL